MYFDLNKLTAFLYIDFALTLLSQYSNIEEKRCLSFWFLVPFLNIAEHFEPISNCFLGSIVLLA